MDSSLKKQESLRRNREGLYSVRVLPDFFDSLVEAFGEQASLYVSNEGNENFDISSQVAFCSFLSSDLDGSLRTKNIGLMVLDLPINWQPSSLNGEAPKYKRNFEFNIAGTLLEYLDSKGLALLTVSSRGLSTRVGKQFLSDLNSKGLYVVGYLELPKKGLNLGIRPLLVAISRKKSENLFLATLDDELDELFVAESLVRRDEALWKEHGHIARNKDFNGFNAERIQSELDGLLKSYSGFEIRPFRDFIEATKTSHRHQSLDIGARSVAVSRFLGGTSKEVVITGADDPSIRPQWIVVDLNDSINPSYLKMFLNSTLGRMCLEGVASGTPHLTLTGDLLTTLEIPVPPLNVQTTLVETHFNLLKLQEQIARLERDLVFSPNNVNSISVDVSSLLGAIGRLTAADEIKALVRSGEDKVTEFKETLSVDLRTGKKEKYIEISALKTVAGFLNTEGGTLLIGVSDDGRIPGVDQEVSKHHSGVTDNYLLHFKNLIKSKIGEKFYPQLDWVLEAVDGKNVLVVRVASGAEPAFLGDDFYVRTNPATDKLQGEKLYKYLSQRFSGRT